MITQILKPWQMYFDGAAKPTGAGILFVSPQEYILSSSFYLGRACTNNTAEYEALIMGLELALRFNITRLDGFGDSELVVKQLTTEY
jgi:ribonuclease HI